ncbi:MAG: peptide chain release factor aRF-1, partial [Candidatus Thalassarchaeaceae archaeon]|nr:peptide chain release factor aRF-1 [Candidatus Thalassarchaeaceae archaeon]
IESASAALGNRRNAGDKGVAVFTGHVIVGNNKTRMKTYIIDNPPEPFTSFRYRCDSSFETSQLEEMLIDRTAYGLLVVDRGEGAYGIASGRTVHCKNHITSLVPSKHRQGGQSQQRFERLIEEAADKFFKKVTERACEYWLPMLPDLKGIIVGGPGATKDFVINNGYLHHEIQKIVKRPLFDVGYSNESGLRELVQNAGDLMDKIELDEERKLVDRFLKEIMNAHPRATYGEVMIRSALDQGAVDTLLLSEALRKKTVHFNCRQCKHEWSLTVEGVYEIPDCPECNADANQVREDENREIDLIDELALLATQSAASVRLISTDSEEGMTLKQAFGGMAALLRWSWS